MKETALYIGRFQPFHLGHSDAIDQIIERDDIGKLFIGIGSAENNYQEKNPLTAGERFEVIETAMQAKNIPAEKYAIVPIRNINHYALWPTHVQQYLPPINMLFSGSPLVRQLWKQAFPSAEVVEIAKRKNISGTVVRKHISENSALEDYILPSTQTLINTWDIATRLQNMKTS